MKDDSTANCCRVSSVEDVVIEPNSEVCVSAKLLDHMKKDNYCMLEGFDTFSEKTGLMVAKAVVDTRTGSGPVRIAYFTDSSVTLFKDTLAAK